MSPTVRKVALLLLVILGVQLWLIVGRGQYGSAPSPVVFLSAVAVVSVPWVYRRVAPVLERVRRPAPRTRAIVMGVVFFVASSYLLATGRLQDRMMGPKVHDEHMHLLQVQMLARGWLWTQPHPVAESFESFHIFVTPKYASVYFPGTALLYVPSVWLHLPYPLMPALVAGGVVALLYRVVAELIDGLAGLLAALLLVSLSEFRSLSLVVMSHSVMPLLGLGVAWAWLRWRHSPTLAWAAVVGALGGWAAITRPVDAICWSTPIAAAMLWTMRGWPVRRSIATVGVIMAAALPFLGLQAILNVGITGNPFKTPYRLYCDLYTPHMSYGFHEFDPTLRPKTNLLQRQIYYDQFTAPVAQGHRPDRLWETWTTRRFPTLLTLSLPSQLLVVLIPCALMVPRGPRWVLPGVLPLFVGFYALFAYLLSFYVVPIAPVVIFLVLGGVSVLLDGFPRLRPWLTCCLTAIIVLLGARALPEFNRLVRDDPFDLPTMAFNHRLPEWVKQPALVLYRYDPTDPTDGEPVYNVDVAWPDDAPIIRAQDLSREQNQRLFAYYAKTQPQRNVYVVDRAKTSDSAYRPLFLGRVTELAGSR